jgi:hypothetical protein
VHAETLERGPLVAGGGVQEQADTEPVAGAGPGRPGDAVADLAAPPLGGEAGEAERPGGDGGRGQAAEVAGAQQPAGPVAAGQHFGLDQPGPADQGGGHAGRPGASACLRVRVRAIGQASHSRTPRGAGYQETSFQISGSRVPGSPTSAKIATACLRWSMASACRPARWRRSARLLWRAASR